MAVGVNDLPVEVMGYVFILAAAHGLGASSWNLYEKRFLRLFSEKSREQCAPFALLQVCAHWRAVAQATSLLWTSFDTTLHDMFIPISTSIATMDHFLSLSHSTPLDFVLETDYPKQDPRKEASSVHAAAVLPILAKAAHRWRSASFHINQYITRMFVDLLLNQFNDTSLPNLRRLEITVYSGEILGPVKDLFRAIGSIKSMKEFYLDSSHDPVPLLISDIPWGQLTTVHINTMLASDEIASILARSTAVVTASFRLVGNESEDADQDVQHCTLQKLKNLGMNGADMLQIFHRIDFPNLERLHFRSSSLECYQLLQWLTKQPNPPIRYLALSAWDELSELDLANWLRVKWLRRVPHVEFHSRNCTQIMAGAVARLEGDQDAPIVWSWGPTQEMLRIGWKTQFNSHDGQVTRITPSPECSAVA